MHFKTLLAEEEIRRREMKKETDCRKSHSIFLFYFFFSGSMTSVRKGTPHAGVIQENRLRHNCQGAMAF